MDRPSGSRLLEFLRHARQRRASSAWLAGFARALTWLALAALVALLSYERAQSQLSLEAHLWIATGVLALALAAGGALALLRTQEPIARSIDRSLASGHLLETASELESDRGRAAPLAGLCVRDAERRVEGRDPDRLFPLPIPNFRWGGAFLAAIVLSAFLPRWGFRGPADHGFGEQPATAGDGDRTPASTLASVASDRAPASAPRPDPPSGVPPKPDSSDSRPKSRPKPKDRDTGGAPPPPKPIPAFTAAPKVVPIDPKAIWRAKRETLVVELPDGGAAGKAAEAKPSAAPKIDEPPVAELQRASEAALAKDGFSRGERAFARRFFDLWLGK